MKLYNLLQARKTLSGHAGEHIPTSLGYKIMKLLKATETEAEFYEEKFRDILDKYKDTEQSNNDKIQIRKECLEQFQKETKELNETDVEVSVRKFTLEELEAIQFSVQELFTLDDFIEESGG